MMKRWIFLPALVALLAASGNGASAQGDVLQQIRTEALQKSQVMTFFDSLAPRKPQNWGLRQQQAVGIAPPGGDLLAVVEHLLLHPVERAFQPVVAMEDDEAGFRLEAGLHIVMGG